MTGLSRVEAAGFRERLAEADVETLLSLDFEGVSLSPEEVEEADEVVALFDRVAARKAA
jgi:hypothetical protein